MADMDQARRDQRARERILKYVREDNNGCWLWTGYTDKDGYGRFQYHAPDDSWRPWRAHRASYLLFVGEIPEGLQLDHLCRTPACVNPAHLEPVTCRENLLRGDTFQARNRAKTHCKRGHPLSGENLRINARGNRVCRACARLDWHARKARVGSHKG